MEHVEILQSCLNKAVNMRVTVTCAVQLSCSGYSSYSGWQLENAI